MNGFLIGDAVTGAALMSVALRPAMGISGFANAEGNEKTAAAATAAYIFTFLHRANEAMGVSATLYKNCNPHEEYRDMRASLGQNNNKKGAQKSTVGEAERGEWWKAISDYKEVSSPEFFNFLTTRTTARTKVNSDGKSSSSNEKSPVGAAPPAEEDAKTNFYEKDHDNMGIGSVWSFPKNASPVPRFAQTNQDGSEISLFIYLHPHLPVFCLAVDTVPVSAPSDAGGFCDDDDDGVEERGVGFPPVGAYVSAAMANLFIRDHGHLILKSVVKSQQIKPADLKAAKKSILPKMKAVYRRAVRGVVAFGIENLLRSIPSALELNHHDEGAGEQYVTSSQTANRGGCGKKSKFHFELEPSHESVGSLKPPGAPPLTSTDIGGGRGGGLVAERFSPLIQTVLRQQKEKREEMERTQTSGKNMVPSAVTAAKRGEEGRDQNDIRNNNTNGNNAAATAVTNVSNSKNKYPIHILSTSLVLVNFEAPPQIAGAFKPKLTKEEKEAEKRREAEQQIMMLNGKKKPKSVGGVIIDLTGGDDSKGKAANANGGGIIGLFFIAPSSRRQQQQHEQQHLFASFVEKSKFEAMPAFPSSYRWAAAEGRRTRQQLIIGARLDAKNSVHRAAIGHHLVHQLSAPHFVTATKAKESAAAEEGGGGQGLADDMTSRRVNLLRAYNALYSNASLTRAAPSSLTMTTTSTLLGSGSGGFGDNNYAGNASTTTTTSTRAGGGQRGPFPSASPFIHSPSSIRHQFETMLIASPSPEISNVLQNNNNNNSGGGNIAATMSSSVASPLDTLLASSTTTNRLTSATTNANTRHQQQQQIGNSSGNTRVGSPSKVNSISRLVSLLLQSSSDAALMLAGLSSSSSQQRSQNSTNIETATATETAAIGGPSKPAGAASAAAAVGWNTNTFIDGIPVPAAVASIFDNVAFPKITITNQVDIVGPLSVGGGSDESVGVPITRVAASAAADSGGIDPRPSLKQLAFEQKLTEALLREQHQHQQELNGDNNNNGDRKGDVRSNASPPTQLAAAAISFPKTAVTAQSIVPTTQIHRVAVGIALSPVFTISIRLNFRVVVRSACTSLHMNDFGDALLDFPSSTEATEYIRNFTKRFVDGIIVVSGAVWRPCLRILFENDIPLS